MFSLVDRDLFDLLGLVLTGASTLLTLVIAVLVYRFTAGQARNETLSAVQEMWQQLNFDIISNDSALKSYRFLFSVPDEVPDEEVRNEYMAFIWANILYLQWSSLQSKLIVPQFAEKALSDQFIRLAPKKEYLVNLLTERGYDKRFIKFAEDSMSGSSSG